MDFRTESVVELAQPGTRRRTHRGRAGRPRAGPDRRPQPDHQRLRGRRRGAGPRRGRGGIDAKVAAGGDPGPLAGIPHRREGPRGRRRLRDHPRLGGLRRRFGPAAADSPLVARLVAAGCVVVGKTNTPELGWKADTDNTVFGPTLNPWNLDHTPGGSSGGSAAAIAVGHGAAGHRLRRRRVDPDPVVVLRAVRYEALARAGAEWGSVAARLAEPLDQGGRWPGAWPTWWPRWTWWSGPIPATCDRCPDRRRRGSAALDDPKPPRKVAWSPTLGYAEVDAEVLAICERAVEVMASLGTEVVEVETVFDADPVERVADPVRRLQPADLRRRCRGTAVWDAGRSGAGHGDRRRGASHRAGSGPGRGRLPHAQPAAGRAVPRRAAADHPDGGRRTAAPIARRVRG